MEIVIIAVLASFLVVQTIRVWMYQAQFVSELKRHCHSVNNHERALRNIAVEAAKKGITIEVRSKADEWPDTI